MCVGTVGGDWRLPSCTHVAAVTFFSRKENGSVGLQELVPDSYG